MVSEINLAEISELNSGITLHELRSLVGTSSHQLIEQLLIHWKSQQLQVYRNWGDPSTELQNIPYSKESFLFPHDQLRWKTASSAVTQFKVATWNVNSIRVRLPLLLQWLQENQPDIVCLQETKVEDHLFPLLELQQQGYHCAYYGQKSYNGVAVLSKYEFDHLQYGFKSGFDSENKRMLVASTGGVSVVNLYIPQGQNTESPKFAYKLEFLNHLYQELESYYGDSSRLVVTGDINIAPDKRDVLNSVLMQDQVSFHPLEHEQLSRWQKLGLEDVFRKFHQEPGLFSWWDFKTRGFERGDGMRIDHVWAHQELAGFCTSCDIDTQPRAEPKTSDHAPVIASFQL